MRIVLRKDSIKDTKCTRVAKQKRKQALKTLVALGLIKFWIFKSKSLKTINVSGVVVPLMRNYNSVVGSVKT